MINYSLQEKHLLATDFFAADAICHKFATDLWQISASTIQKRKLKLGKQISSKNNVKIRGQKRKKSEH